MKWLVALLAVALIAGYAGSALASMHDIPPISIGTDRESYSDGDRITVSGSIKEVDPAFMGAVTIQVRDPDNNLVIIQQVVPDSDGDYTSSLTAGGPLWRNSGDYTIRIVYLSNDIDTTISYTATPQEPEVPEVPEPPPAPTPVCGEGTELVDGVCQIIQQPPAVVEQPPTPPPTPEPDPMMCGEGTELVDGQCVPVQEEPEARGGGCLIATAAFASEMAPQVQFLREVRDNKVMSTASGASFMSGFNQAYYAISPQIADMERESPVFREVVRVAITPMIASLGIMDLAEEGSEISVLATGILVIVINAMMYVAAPAMIGIKAYGKIRAARK